MINNKPKIRTLHTIPDVAEMCQVSTKTVRRWINNGELIAHILGSQYRISPADLASFLAIRRMSSHDN